MAYILFSLPRRLCHSALHLPNRPDQSENICTRRSASVCPGRTRIRRCHGGHKRRRGCDSNAVQKYIWLTAYVLSSSLSVDISSFCSFLFTKKERNSIRALIHPWALGLAYIRVRSEKLLGISPVPLIYFSLTLLYSKCLAHFGLITIMHFIISLRVCSLRSAYA